MVKYHFYIIPRLVFATILKAEDYGGAIVVVVVGVVVFGACQAHCCLNVYKCLKERKKSYEMR